MTVETQTITRGAWGTDLGRVLTRTAIPWCTFHDYQAMSDVIGCPADYRGLDESCDISTGGPDHKWWKDE